MFNPLKGIGDIKKLRDEAMKLQKELQTIEVTSEKGKAFVLITGDMKVKSVKLNGMEQPELKEALNDAIGRAQKQAASKMQSMGGLQGLLGQ